METDTKIAPIPSTKIAGGQLSVIGGTVLPETMKEVESLAQYMAKAGSAIPYSMQGNPGECMAVIMDAISWRMNPWAVARQRYVTKSKDGHLTGGYMGQLFIAVLNTRAGLKERLVPVYDGTGPNLVCKLRGETADGQVLDYESPPISKISPKNSPLWTSDERQQLFYYSGRAFGRRYFSDLFMGIYDQEEVEHIARMRDVTPKETINALDDGEDAPAHVHEGEVMPSEKKAPGVDFAQDAREIAEDMAQNPEHYNQETGEIEEPERPVDEEGQGGLGLTEPDANTIKVNLMKGIKACRTLADLNAWKAENVEALKDRDVRKAASDKAFDLEYDPGRF